jgi:excisionase family DNA binding protein
MKRSGVTMQGTRRDTPDERLILTIDEAARALGIGRNSAFAAAHRGEIPTIRIGRRLLVPKVAFEKMLANCISGDVDVETTQENPRPTTTRRPR